MKRLIYILEQTNYLPGGVVSFCMIKRLAAAPGGVVSLLNFDLESELSVAFLTELSFWQE